MFITNDRIAVFSSASVIESTEHYRDFQTAKTHVVSVLEGMRGNIQAYRFRGNLPARVLDSKGIPPHFFYVCGSSIEPAPKLERVEKIGGLWRLTLFGANGNSAVVSLKGNYETADVQLSGSATCGY